MAQDPGFHEGDELIYRVNNPDVNTNCIIIYLDLSKNIKTQTASSYI